MPAAGVLGSDSGAAVRCSSMPPPSAIMLVLEPPGPLIEVGAGVVLVPGTADGLVKYSEMAPFCFSVVAPISHSNRKNAIMAVAKSANATFHEPPW